MRLRSCPARASRWRTPRASRRRRARQLHLARHRRVMDTSTLNNRDIFFGGALYPPEDSFEMIDRSYIASVREKLVES